MCLKWLEFLNVEELMGMVPTPQHKKRQECIICKWIPSTQYQSDWGHIMWTECIQGWVVQLITQGNVLSMQCPFETWTHVFTDSQVQQLIQPQIYIK